LGGRIVQGADRSVGCLVVVDQCERPVGIITDRDLAMRVVAEGRDSDMTSVAEVMTAPAGCVDELTSIEQALKLMRQGGFRRLPVVDSTTGRLGGIFTLDDILMRLSAEFQDVGKLIGSEAPQAMCPA